ncbi:restriction endonuclease subunit R [Methylacidiphilum caldifontis]|uniref:Restriction endonuclease subunit R n=1 Tax=Methylacidiphilum caldifontis TaxID=2795386 RepID=A0A4Y8P7D8_9BACT|nr:restriction endonuclease subunit R [Methylacidiphilum caldifontis]
MEKYHVLNKYIFSLLGINDFRDLQQKLQEQLKDVSVGAGNIIRLLDNLRKDKLSEADLLRYNSNIQSYVEAINKYRRELISLKYFQYLAVLFTDIVLDNLKNKKKEFLAELNEFLKSYKQKQDIEIIDEFTEKDLNKLAFWMATGSGKTLIMHINYYQFLRYKIFSPESILLITPNEGLSKQHFEELRKSGIPCQLYSGSFSCDFRNDNQLLVIEITKFVEEKKGDGLTLSVSSFEGRKLIFVDEGHKGKREEQKWAAIRNKLAENGFVFEYSATFGQILSERNQQTLREYAKSILFDYSYKYFYLDGYGKDFSVLNVGQPKISDQEFQEIMFVANLLSFYEQLLVYEQNNNLAKEHNIERPLWIFVGTTVTGKEGNSDVIQILELINKAIKYEDWLKKCVNDILQGNTKLKNEEGLDVFSDKFTYFKSRRVNIDDLYRNVFYGRGSLCIYELKNSEGELGLKISEKEYFGVINIGDVSGFKKQLEKDGISIEQDAISTSLFEDIKREGSKINLLIGAKKFIEGWDSWRVSSMGLLNIGTGHGPQIIQLFGRGIRLKGKGMSLKRSKRNEIHPLETLNIYSIKADYLSKFLEAIRREDVEFETIQIPIEPLHENRWRTLYILSKDKNKKFEEEKVLKFDIDDKIRFSIDPLPKASVYLSSERKEGKITKEKIKENVQSSKFPADKMDILDWDRIWQEVCEIKVAKGYWNLVLDRNGLKRLLLSNRFKVIGLPDIFDIKRKEDLLRVEEIALLVIKKYLDLFYENHAKRFETENLYYTTIGTQSPLSAFEKEYGYTIQIDKTKRKNDLITGIKKLAKDLIELFNDDDKLLPRIYFDRLLYVPILLQNKNIDKISPVGLVDSEYKFVKGLREYWNNNQDKYMGVEIYLLRNYPFSGVGFQLQWAKFYPDFIMWVKENNKQTIVFIDPKGLIHSKGLHDEKIQFSKEIKDIEKGLKNSNIQLESFILSVTSYDELVKGRNNPPTQKEYENNHLLFLDDNSWCEKLFTCLKNGVNITV